MLSTRVNRIDLPHFRTFALVVGLAIFVISTAPARSATASGDVKGSEGVERIIAELREREATLETIERELKAREQSVRKLENQLEKRMAELESMRATVEKRIATWSSQDGDRIKRLAKVYSEMPSGKAASLLQKLDRDLATSILSGMKDKTSAAVLAEMPRSEAIMLSKRLVRPLASEVGRKQ
jgi:flagellar motility protein MotE (MotC chaperone)